MPDSFSASLKRQLGAVLQSQVTFPRASPAVFNVFLSMGDFSVGDFSAGLVPLLTFPAYRRKYDEPRRFLSSFELLSVPLGESNSTTELPVDKRLRLPELRLHSPVGSGAPLPQFFSIADLEHGGWFRPPSTQQQGDSSFDILSRTLFFGVYNTFTQNGVGSGAHRKISDRLEQLRNRAEQNLKWSGEPQYIPYLRRRKSRQKEIESSGLAQSLLRLYEYLASSLSITKLYR